MAMEGDEHKLIPEWLKGTVGGGKWNSSYSNSHNFAHQSIRGELYIKGYIENFSACDFPKRNSSRRQLPDVTQKRNVNDNWNSAGDAGRGNRNRIRRNTSPRTLDGDQWDGFVGRNSWNSQSRKKKDGLDTSAFKEHYDPPVSVEKLSASAHSERTQNGYLRQSRSTAVDAPFKEARYKLRNATIGVKESQLVCNASLDREFPHLEVNVKRGGHESQLTRCAFVSRLVSSKSQESDGGLSSASSCSPRPQSSGSSNGLPDWKAALCEPPALTSSSPVGYQPSGRDFTSNIISSQKTSHESVSQISDECQRIRELSLKQSLQLIPVTPTSRGVQGHGLLGRTKTRSSMAAGVTGVTEAAKSSNSLRYLSKPGHSDVNLLILKTGDQGAVMKQLDCMKFRGSNGFCHSSCTQPSNFLCENQNNNQFWRTMDPVSPALASGALTQTSAGNRAVETLLGLHGALDPCVEIKRQTVQCLKKDRKDFFNSLRQKKKFEDSSTNDSTSVNKTLLSDPEEASACSAQSCNDQVSPVNVNSEDETVGLNSYAVAEMDASDVKEEQVRAKVNPEEEKYFRLLRELGWDEKGKAEALTDEEIYSFLEENMQVLLARNILRGKTVWKFWLHKFYAGSNSSSMASVCTN